MIPRIPAPTAAYVQCGCGGTAKIATVAPIAEDPDHMRHAYTCLECGEEMSFIVAKKSKAQGAAHG